MRSKIFWLVVIILLVLVAIGLAGPRVPIDTTIRPIILPSDLDQYLQNSEAKFADIVPQTEKKIIWAGEPNQRTEYSVVYLHGFTATRQETAPLSDNVAKALGANLYYNRFAGHGLPGKEMEKVTVNDWVNDTWEAYQIGRTIGEKVIVIGVSTGGTNATWLMAQPDTDQLFATILISPNFGPKDGSSELLPLPWGKQLAHLVMGDEISRGNDPNNYWTNPFPTDVLLPMMGIVTAVRQLPLEKIKSPLQIIYASGDKVVDAKKIESTYARIGSPKKELILFEDSPNPNQHLLAGDIASPSTTDQVAQLIVSFVSGINPEK